MLHRDRRRLDVANLLVDLAEAPPVRAADDMGGADRLTGNGALDEDADVHVLEGHQAAPHAERRHARVLVDSTGHAPHEERGERQGLTGRLLPFPDSCACQRDVNLDQPMDRPRPAGDLQEVRD